MKLARLITILLPSLLFLACNEDQPVQVETPASPTPRPNIVIIMADDLGYSDLGCYGGEISTPNIDQLAVEGMKFSNFYNAGRCCPTRASVLTGLYSHQAGLGLMLMDLDFPTYRGFLTENCMTLAEVAKTADYSTYMSGKWHVGESPERWPRQRGFDHYFGLISGVSSYYECSRGRTMVFDDTVYTPPDQFYMTDAIGDQAVNYIHEAANKDEAFLMMVTFTAPHWPLHALPEDIEKYQHTYDIGWDSTRTLRLQKMKALGLLDQNVELTPRPHTVPAWDTVENKAEWARRMAVYAAMVDRMDQNIGKVMEALQQHELDENTIVIFLSDNGGSNEVLLPEWNDSTKVIGEKGSYVAYREPWANVSDVPFRLYKQWMHEGGIASPLIVRWPASIQPQEGYVRTTSHVIDLMPTMVDLIGANYPQEFKGNAITPLEGMSLAPILLQQKSSLKRTLYWEHKGNRAVLDGNLKLVSRYPGKWELYDLSVDRTEMNNLAASRPEEVDRLAKLWQAWADAKGVKTREQIQQKKREKAGLL